MALIFDITERYEDFLKDESKLVGSAETISFPETVEEVVEIVKMMRAKDRQITIQGGRTGIEGSAVPSGGHILNLSHMDKVIAAGYDDVNLPYIKVQSGMTLTSLQEEIRSRFKKERLFFPIEPTEGTATIGGIIAMDANGISRRIYKGVVDYITDIKLIDFEGSEKTVSKDLVIGKEGSTGAICEVTLKLANRPKDMWGIAFFFDRIGAACKFAENIKKEKLENEKAYVSACEYIDETSIRMVEGRKSTLEKIRELPDIEERIVSMIYVEISGEAEGVEELAEMCMNVFDISGGNPDDTWAVSTEVEIERLRVYRHAAAESANMYIEEARKVCDKITKISSDVAFSDMAFGQMLEMYTSDLKAEGLLAAIFGHVLENHLYVNILPKDEKDYNKGKKLLKKWTVAYENCSLH